MWTASAVDSELSPFDDSPGRLAIVALGYALNDDGSMAPQLIDRLEKTLEAANAFPEAIIVVSGGVPRAGKVEAVEMRRWLTERGVAAERIHEEGYARDVVENLVYSRYILDLAGADATLLVTSAIDVRRAGAGMDILDWLHGSPRPVSAIATGRKSDAGFVDGRDDRLKLYRDALRAYGLPMMRCYPELVER